MKPKIAKIVVGLPVEGPFDYLIKDEMQETIAIGMRVRVFFNRRKLVGYIVGFAETSEFQKLNTLIDVLDDVPVLGSAMMVLAQQMSEYYGCSLGEAIECCLPASLRLGRKIKDPISRIPQLIVSQPEFQLKYGLDHEQYLTTVLAQIKECLAAGKGVMWLVPEALQVVTVAKYLKANVTEPVYAFGKSLTAKVELEQWVQLRNEKVCVVVGTRSSVFVPVNNLGLIIVDQEDGEAYKQEQLPHYHVHQIVQMRAQLEGCKVIVASETPSIETWGMAQREQWQKDFLRPLCAKKIQVIDMENYNPQKTSLVSAPLKTRIEQLLAERKTILLVMNRRGFTTMTRCNQCGHEITCPRCDVKLTYLHSKQKSICRHCNFQMDLPNQCPKCHGAYMKSMGRGIEKLEDQLSRLFLQAKVSSYDKDSKGKPKGDIIIATQAILRWQHALKFNDIAMLDLDAEISYFDYRCSQRAFSLMVKLYQWAQEQFTIQTRMPEYAGIKYLEKLDFEKFYTQELEMRKELVYPPYTHLIAVGLRGQVEETVLEQAHQLFTLFHTLTAEGIKISEPHPDVFPKVRDKYRYTITLKCSDVIATVQKIKVVLKGFKKKRGTIVTINVDP